MTILWLITDNKPGHRSQLQGLAQALAARTKVDAHWIDAPAGRSALWHWLAGRFPPGAGLPDPPHAASGISSASAASRLAAMPVA